MAWSNVSAMWLHWFGIRAPGPVPSVWPPPAVSTMFAYNAPGDVPTLSWKFSQMCTPITPVWPHSTSGR